MKTRWSCYEYQSSIHTGISGNNCEVSTKTKYQNPNSIYYVREKEYRNMIQCGLYNESHTEVT